MRSRYTAFTRGATDYLMATWHPQTRPDTLDDDQSVTWLGLEVLDRSGTRPSQPGHPKAAQPQVGDAQASHAQASHAQASQPQDCQPQDCQPQASQPSDGEPSDGEPSDGETGEVEFVARFRVAGREQQLHERSRFVRSAGRWLYRDGH
jgi:uncharacterized protein YchJ